MLLRDASVRIAGISDITGKAADHLLEIARDIDAGRRDNENIPGNLLQVTFDRVAGTGYEINNALRDIHVDAFQIQDDGPVF